MKMKAHDSNVRDAAKAVLMRFIAIQSYPRKKRKISNKQHNLIPQRRQWHPIPLLLPGKSRRRRSLVGCSPWGREELDTTERLQFHFHPLEKEMATHSSILAWRIPGTEEPGGLLSMGLHRVRHDWCDLAEVAAVNLHLKQLGREEQLKPQVSRRKEMIKIRTERKELETKKTMKWKGDSLKR